MVTGGRNGRSHPAVPLDGVLPRREQNAMKKEDLHLDVWSVVLSAIGVILGIIAIILAL